ncbi:hypothetical protein FB446DRAFT_706893 [Lentinula raphanica]|nr:hypothetical protein FB446DRAFT_706893 [Lentinula raphanica]
MDLLPGSGGFLVIGFDTEWNIALRDEIYILKVGRQVASQQLPHQLVLFFKDPRIIKAGRMVTADLRQLKMISGKGPFAGGLELGTFTKQRFLISDARSSLADLTAEILGKCLPKNCAEHICTNWDDNELTPAQIDYAALDAYASLVLFNCINAIPLPELVTTSTLSGTRVILLSSDKKKIIAHGTLTSPHDLGIQLTSAQVTVCISQIIVPGAKLKKHTLSDFGELPFDVVCLRSLLRVEPATHIHVPLESRPNPTPTPTPTSTTDTTAQANTCKDSDATVLKASEEMLSYLIESESGGATIDVNSIERDESSIHTAEETLGPRDLALPEYAQFIWSCVLKDPFHVFNMIYIPKSHALRIPFAQALRDAMLIPHPEDKRRVLDWLRTKGLTWDFILKFKSHWVWKHVRRTIPPPELLYPAIHNVFSKYGPLKDAKTGLPLFSSSTWKVVKNILELNLWEAWAFGGVSRLSGLKVFFLMLYYCIGLDFQAGGLRVWRCICGTNMTEGGVHTHLRPRMPTRGTSIRHMRACLLDFVLHHNLHVGTFNSTGQKFRHHDYIWLTNEIQELELTLAEYYPQQITPSHASMSVWVNGNLYKQTNEEIGILSLPSSIIEASGMRPFMPEIDHKKKQAFLAELQEFYTSQTELSVNVVKIWNRHAETNPDVYYELSKHLSQYASGDWEKTANLKQSLSQAFEITDAVKKQTRDPGCSDSIVHATEAPLLRQQVTKGFIELPGIHSDSNANTTITTQISHKRAMKAQLEPVTKRVRTSRHCIQCGQGAGQCKGTSAWTKLEASKQAQMWPSLGVDKGSMQASWYLVSIRKLRNYSFLGSLSRLGKNRRFGYSSIREIAYQKWIFNRNSLR